MQIEQTINNKKTATTTNFIRENRKNYLFAHTNNFNSNSFIERSIKFSDGRA